MDEDKAVQNIATLNNEFEPTLPDAPEFTKGIRKKPYYNGGNKDGIPLDIPFTPFNHSTTEIPVQDGMEVFGHAGGENPEPEPVSSFATGVAQFKHINDTSHLIHADYVEADKLLSLKGAFKDPNFNPMDYADKFLNIQPEYQGYLLGAESEADINFRLKRINQEQKNQNDIKNGTWLGYLMGGTLGMTTDLTNYIPIVNAVKYATYGKTLLSVLARTAPSALAYGGISSLGEQLDSINGNMHDFLIDTLNKTVFATVLFGGAGVVSLSADKSVLWKLSDYMADQMKGIGYRLKVDDKGAVKGIEAHDMTGGGVSADKVKLAQDKADSQFFKGGLFKLPYVGTAAEKFLSNRFLGSPTLEMLLSPYKTVRTVIDLAYDHGITTQGLAEGKMRPITFFSLMQKTSALIREQSGQFNAMHMQRNGVDLKNYVAQSAVKAGMYTRDKTMDVLGKELGDKPYISVPQFAEEVQQVLFSEKPSEHAAVNDAAAMFRKSMDEHYTDWRTAFNLPADWMPQRTSMGYLMRVYDTNFLNNNEDEWTRVISNYLRDADNTIATRMKPINDLETVVKDFEEQHTQAIRELGQNPTEVANRTGLVSTSKEVGNADVSIQLSQLKARLKAMKETLQNEIRNDPKLQLHAEDWNALSADEAKELKATLKPITDIEKSIEDQKKVISELKAEKSKALYSAKEKTTKEKAKPKADVFAATEQKIGEETKKLNELHVQLSEARTELYSRAHKGEINRRFFSIKNNEVEFKDPSDRLKLRKTYHEQKGFMVEEEEAHEFRKEHAKSYYDTIMNQTAEDTINQVMGRFTGNGQENHIKSRTLIVPDEILYNNNFMTKDLLSKVANYQTWLARRTHLKNVYSGVTLDGGFDNIIADAHAEFQSHKGEANDDKAKIEEKLKAENLSEKEKAKLEKALEQVDFKINSVTKDFNKAKKQLTFVYQKMTGISKLSNTQKAILSSIKSFTAMANLGFLPIAMITDLSANGLKHGLLPFVQSGIYPAIQSLGGLIKTHDSASLRFAAGAANLSLHHIGSRTASRNYELETNPYLNMGKIPNFLSHASHIASNFAMTTAIDNFLQRFTAGIVQSEIIRMMHSFKEGNLSKSDRMWLNRYGLDPEKDHEAIINAFKASGGGKTSVGGYQSNYWQWQDMGAANKVSDAVFRATHDTIISANVLDTPRWLDENGPLNIAGPIIKGFKGWAFASLNRYVIPTLQEPDARKLSGVALMVAAGALVSPLRRMAKGEDPYRENQTGGQIAAEILQDSPWFSYFAENLNDANLISGGRLLGKFKNEKYEDRARAGALGPFASDINKMANFMTSMALGDMNEHDTLQMAGMIPPLNSTWGWQISQNIVKSFGLPKHSQR